MKQSALNANAAQRQPDDRGAACAGDEALQPLLERALARRGGRLALPRLLDQRYRQFAMPALLEQVRRAFWILAAIQAACTIIDLGTVPQLAATALWLRWGICIPLCLLAIAVCGRPVPVAVRHAAIIAPFLAEVAVATLLGMQSPEPYADRYFMAAGMSIALVNVLFPLEFAQATAQTLLSLAVYAALLVPGLGLGLAHVGQGSDLVLFAAAIAGGSLESTRRLEARNRRIFLLRLRDELRSQELQKVNEQLMILSLRDPLTGVGNRRSFDLALAQAWNGAVQAHTAVALLMVDADYFKAYNDALGHAEGDACLRAVARALQDSLCGRDDHLARYGGEEFAVLLPGADVQQAHAVAERMRRAVEAIAMAHPGSAAGPFVTISVGVASLQPRAADGGRDSLVQAADEALYRAKHEGRNRVALSVFNRNDPQPVTHSTAF